MSSIRNILSENNNAATTIPINAIETIGLFTVLINMLIKALSSKVRSCFI